MKEETRFILVNEDGEYFFDDGFHRFNTKSIWRANSYESFESAVKERRFLGNNWKILQCKIQVNGAIK